MSLSNFRAAQGFEIIGAGWILSGSGAPLGTSGITDDAPIGSLWTRTDGSGLMYHKVASTSSATDWKYFANQEDVDAIAGGSTETVAVPAATPTSVSSCLVDDCNFIEWEWWAYETADETKREGGKVTCLHDGESGSDATTFDYAEHTNLKLPTNSIAGLTYAPALAGVTTAQTISLQISATAAITVIVRRTELPAL